MSYWCSQFRYKAILPTSCRPESHILPDKLTILYCYLNGWNHRHQSRLKYSTNFEKYHNNAFKAKYIGISKYFLVSWRISMLCDGFMLTMLLHILLPAKCTVTQRLSHRRVAELGWIYNTIYKFWHRHTQNKYTWTLYILSRLIMTIFAQYYMYQWLQCGIKYDSWHISSPAQNKAEDVTLNTRYKSEGSNKILFSKLYFILDKSSP